MSLIWLCHSRSLNNRITRIHERALRIVFNDNISSFDELINKFGSARVHHRNLQFLVIEIYKALHNLSPPLMSELFQLKDIKYNFRQGKNPYLQQCKKRHTMAVKPSRICHRRFSSKFLDQ